MATSVRFEIFAGDLDATVDFYTRVLGFTLVLDRRRQTPGYVSLERDGVRIGATTVLGPGRAEHRRPPTGVEVVLEVDDVRAELARVREAQWPLEEGLVEREWGLRDFRVLDPGGYYLRLTERGAS